MMFVLLILMLSRVSDVQGEPLYIQLMPDVTGNRFLFKQITQHGERGIFRYSKNNILFSNESFSSSVKQRLHFTAMNGTITINPATERDSGTYRVEIIRDNEGESLKEIAFQMIIHALGEQSPATSTNRNITSACLSVILLCGAVGVLYACKRRTNTHKPAETTELENSVVSTLTRPPEQENAEIIELEYYDVSPLWKKQPEQEASCKEKDLADKVYANVGHGE
ncbi:uncharacterized protein LOC134069271 isoform X2 [Sardina pilchardus]|uniref:uncharacterized protein LOC134069271 isoform X2 n=1 Tax=Sardina pilchardus TaxID=27697 RepID=UPI002E16129B